MGVGREVKSLDEVLVMFKGYEMTSVSRENKVINGIWFKYGQLENFFFVPVRVERESDVDLISYLKDGPISPVDQGERDQEKGQNSELNRLRKLKRDNMIILQLILYTFQKSGLTVDRFMAKYIVKLKQDETGDSSQIYDLSKVDRHLPVDNIMVSLEAEAPTLVRNGQFYLYSKKYVEIVRYFLEQSLKSRAPEVTELRGLFSTEEDFRVEPGVSVFLGVDSLNNWRVDLKRKSVSNLRIRSKIEVEYALYDEPYIYMLGDKMWLVQNVYEGDFLRAFQVAYEWFQYKVNRGYGADRYTGQLKVNKVYEISPKGELMVKTDNSGNSDRYVELLDYGNGDYAGLLLL